MTMDALDQFDDAYPLTPLQQGMLFHVLSEPDGNDYIGLVTALIEGPLTAEAAHNAWETILARHEALRTAFVWEGLDQPMQVVHKTAALDFQWITDADWRAHAQHLAQQPLDITHPALMKIHIVRQDDTHSRLIWVVHHLIADGWSSGIVLREFLALLNGATLPEPPIFADHAAWLDTLDHAQGAAFWQDYFDGFVQTPLDANHARTGFASVTDQMTPEVLTKLTLSAKDEGVTLSTVLQTGFARALGKFSATEDVMFGLASSGRSSPIDGVAECVGLFVNTLPIRVNIAAPNLAPRLEEIGLALRAREHVPQSVLARYSHTPPGRNMVDVVLSLRNLPDIQPNGDFRIADFTAQTPSNFPLTIEMDPQSGAINALFDTAVLDGDQVRDFLDDFIATLDGSQDGNETLSVLTGPELTSPPEDVVARFLKVAAARPGDPAVSGTDQSLTFADLHNKAQSVAAYLADQGMGPGDRVALILPRTADFVVALLGTLIAGAAYVPIDSNYPAQRISDILADCAPKLTIGTGAPGQVDIASIPVGRMAEAASCAPHDPAYLIYTSGSTGKPKGVEISRGALATSQAARDQFYPDPPQAFLLISPFAFDSSVVGIFWALTNGAHLIIAAHKAEQDMAALGALIAQHRATHTLMLPTLYQAMLEGAQTDDLQSLRCVIVAGEACPQNLPQIHTHHLPHSFLVNEYGPTEATVWATADIKQPGEETPLTIGAAIPSAQVFILNAEGAIAARGETGEIALAGPTLATGYFGRPEETKEAFPNLTQKDGLALRIYKTGDRGQISPDGRLVYLGRGDGQVKIRGHRIEIAEVEAAIASVEGVRTVSVGVVPARPAASSALEAALARLSESDAKTLIAKAGGSL